MCGYGTANVRAAGNAASAIRSTARKARPVSRAIARCIGCSTGAVIAPGTGSIRIISAVATDGPTGLN